MRVLHLVLATVVALASINNGVALASKTALRSQSNEYTALEANIASEDIDSEARKGAAGGGGGVGGGGGGTAYRPVYAGYGGHRGDGGDGGYEAATLPPGVYVGPEFGGPHGDDFTDASLVKSGQKVLSIILRAAERVDAVILTIVNPAGEENTFYHGGFGGVLKTPLTLAQGEYITVMEAHAGKHKGRTRVKYIKFTTNLGNFIEGGTQTDKTGSDTAEDGYQLGGFAGRSGDELDLVSAIWTSIQPVV
ncbi:Jacalin-like lectin domain [Phytophthora infestans]|uniref:Jacalin-like lectin domain n=1 Tax=Phytophthora infestans TaxID=4787 RepID=A0A8S9UFQ9_PHYIN|nr:Jacalin-like lectin domain [Phytophthora infestans]